MKYINPTITDAGRDLLTQTNGNGTDCTEIDQAIFSNQKNTSNKPLSQFTVNDFNINNASVLRYPIVNVKHQTDTIQPEVTLDNSKLNAQYPVYMIGVLAHAKSTPNNEILLEVEESTDDPLIMPRASDVNLNCTFALPIALSDSDNINVIMTPAGMVSEKNFNDFQISVTQSLGSQSTKVSSNSNDILANTQNIRNNSNNINILESSVASNSNSIASNAQSIATNSNNINLIQDSVSVNSSNISTNTSNIASIQSNMANNSALSNLESSVNSNSSQINNDESSIISNTTNANNNSSNINSLSTQINSNSINIDTNSSNISSIQSNMANNSSLSSLQDAVNSNSGMIQNNSSNIAALTCHVFANALPINPSSSAPGFKSIDLNNIRDGLYLFMIDGADIKNLPSKAKNYFMALIYQVTGNFQSSFEGNSVQTLILIGDSNNPTLLLSRYGGPMIGGSWSDWN